MPTDTKAFTPRVWKVSEVLFKRFIRLNPDLLTPLCEWLACGFEEAMRDDYETRVDIALHGWDGYTNMTMDQVVEEVWVQISDADGYADKQAVWDVINDA